MRYVQKGNSGEQIVYEHFILKKVALSGKHIKSASARRNDLTGVPEIHFTLNPIGANKFAKVTERHRVGNGDDRLLAIVVDGKLVSAPSISINGRFHSRGQITGDFTFEEAMTLTGSGSVVRKLELMDGSGGWVRKDRSAVTLLSVMPSAFGTFPTFIEQYNPFMEQYAAAASISINGRFHSRGQITGDFTIEEATALANALENQLENQVLLNQVVLIEEKDLK
jgi:preprotein translocase subunit SecD